MALNNYQLRAASIDITEHGSAHLDDLESAEQVKAAHPVPCKIVRVVFGDSITYRVEETTPF